MQAVTLISQNRTVCSFFTVWLLRREGDHELIMAFTLVQTYSTCRHSSQVGHSCWMNCSTFALKIPALTQGDKQNSELMKPLLSWFSAASPAAVFTSCEISFREYLTWLFFFLQTISQHYELSRSCCEQWDEALQAGGTHRSLLILWGNTIHAARLSPSLHWFLWHIRNGT